MIETINLVNREIAEITQIDEDTVKSINSFYWKAIKAAISTGDHTSVRIKNLGTLVISRNKVNKYIKLLIHRVREYTVSGKSFKSKSNKDYIDETLGILRKMLARRNDIAIVYKQKEDRIRLKRI